MKKKILFSVMIIALVGALVGVGIFAYFSDIETSAPNTFIAGTIDLEVNDENPWTTAAVTTELTDLKPCEIGLVAINLTNVGTNPMDVWKIITAVSTGAGNETEPESGEPDANDIDGVIRYSETVTGTGASASGNITEAGNFTISDGSHQLTGITNAVKDQYIYLGTIAPGETMTVEQGYHMDEDTTNWAQGDTMTFTIEFLAQQTVGSIAAPAPELAGHGK